MKKISKKIVSLVTLAAFALTLVPATAFAAGPVDAGQSDYAVTAGTNQLTVDLTLNGEDGTAVDGSTYVKVTVTDTKGNTLGEGNVAKVAGNGLTETTVENVDALENGVAPGIAAATYTFTEVPSGSYTVKVEASVNNANDYAPLDNGSRFLSCLVYPRSACFTGFPGHGSFCLIL